MKVTQEMIDAVLRIPIDHSRPAVTAIRMVEAVLKVIDPVPEQVNAITDGDGDRWIRSKADPLTWTYYNDPAWFRTYGYIEREYGPVTWEGK